MPNETIVRVAVPAPLYTPFDYLPPVDCDLAGLQPGCRVQVPFGHGTRCGLIMALQHDNGREGRRLKRIDRVLDRQPLFSRQDLALLRWVAAYYHHPIGEVVAAALPVRLRRGEAPLETEWPGWRLTEAGAEQDPAALARAPRQAEMLRVLGEAGGVITQELLYAQVGACRTILRALQQKGWLEPCEIARWQPQTDLSASPPRYRLHAEQQQAVEQVASELDAFHCYLLDGVTGSGKTEVYLQLVQHALGAGRQVLILVPEIGLTPQLLMRFQQRLPVATVVLHSGLSETERERAWHHARKGEARVVLGTRSAIFTPLPELGLVIVDEEHDLSFKQQDGLRYSARDLAVTRAQRADCPVILGSATPSLESLRNAREGRYRHLLLRQRAGGAKAPRLDLLDIRSMRLDAGVSPTLAGMIGQELEAGNQVLLFLNRRGYAPVLTCQACGWMAQCRRCDARMTLHLSSRLLWCHHCGSQRPVDVICPECGGDALRTLGQGTERLQERLQQRFPAAGVVRIDRDSTRRKGSLVRLLEEIREGKHSLLLGTQMLAKGHHFPDVTLVGILDVDQGLFGADYRAAERMAQLIIQVAGRSGRAQKPGRVILQTRHPDHPLLQTLLREGYQAFAEIALRERREAGLPPYGYQALLRSEAHDEGEPQRFLEQAVEQAGPSLPAGVALWGPVPAPMERRAGRYRAHLLVQSENRLQLQRFLTEWLPPVRQLKMARKVRWSVDVDPQEMF